MLLGNHFMKTYKKNPQDSKKSPNKTPKNKLWKVSKTKQEFIGKHTFIFILFAIILHMYILGRGKKKKNQKAPQNKTTQTSKGKLEIFLSNSFSSFYGTKTN